MPLSSKYNALKCLKICKESLISDLKNKNNNMSYKNQNPGNNYELEGSSIQSKYSDFKAFLSSRTRLWKNENNKNYREYQISNLISPSKIKF